MKLSSPLIKSTIVASIGGLLFGFDTAVISGKTAALSPSNLGITVASALIGTIFGAMLAPHPK